MTFSKNGQSNIFGSTCSSKTLPFPPFPSLWNWTQRDCGGLWLLRPSHQRPCSFHLALLILNTDPQEPSPGSRKRPQVEVLAPAPARASARNQHLMSLCKGMSSQMIPVLRPGVLQLRSFGAEFRNSLSEFLIHRTHEQNRCLFHATKFGGHFYVAGQVFPQRGSVWQISTVYPISIGRNPFTFSYSRECGWANQGTQRH